MSGPMLPPQNPMQPKIQGRMPSGGPVQRSPASAQIVAGRRAGGGPSTAPFKQGKGDRYAPTPVQTTKESPAPQGAPFPGAPYHRSSQDVSMPTGMPTAAWPAARGTVPLPAPNPAGVPAAPQPQAGGPMPSLDERIAQAGRSMGLNWPPNDMGGSVQQPNVQLPMAQALQERMTAPAYNWPPYQSMPQGQYNEWPPTKAEEPEEGEN